MTPLEREVLISEFARRIAMSGGPYHQVLEEAKGVINDALVALAPTETVKYVTPCCGKFARSYRSPK